MTGQAPTDEERALLEVRARAVDGEEMIDAVLDRSGATLVDWIFGRSEQ